MAGQDSGTHWTDNIWATNGGIYCGYEAPYTEGPAPQLNKQFRYIDDRHLYTVGGSGSGKTRRLLLPAAFELTGWSEVIVDPKGDLCKMTMAHRRAAGNEVIVLDPFGVTGFAPTGFNPIASLELTDDFPDDALGLAETVIRVEGKEPYFSQAAQDFVTALIMYVRLLVPDGSFADVRALLGLDDAGMRALVLSPDGFVFERAGREDMTLPGMIAAGEMLGWEEIGIKAARFGDINPENRELHAVISTALTQTRWLDSRPIKRSLAGPSFDFTVMKDRPVVVYIILPSRRLVSHSGWMRLMVGSIVQNLMTDAMPGEVPVLLMLDEYFALAEGDGFPAISRNMAQMRGYGIKLWTVWQDLSQAKTIYGDTGFETFISNAGVLQAFAPQDLVTAQYLSDRTGQTTREITSYGKSETTNPAERSGGQITENINVGQIPMPLMMPQDMRNMDAGFTVAFSHSRKGAGRLYLPFPNRLPHLKEAVALDPANQATTRRTRAAL